MFNPIDFQVSDVRGTRCGSDVFCGALANS